MAKRVFLTLVIAGVSGILLMGVAATTRQEGGGGLVLDGSFLQHGDASSVAGVVTYTPSGGALFSSANHPTVSAHHGGWVRGAADRQFDVMFWAVRFATNGAPIGYTRVRAQLILSLDGDRYDASFLREVYDLDFRLLGSAANTGRGERIHVEPIG